jgi:hypothetical protein
MFMLMWMVSFFLYKPSAQQSNASGFLDKKTASEILKKLVAVLDDFKTVNTLNSINASILLILHVLSICLLFSQKLKSILNWLPSLQDKQITQINANSSSVYRYVFNRKGILKEVNSNNGTSICRIRSTLSLSKFSFSFCLVVCYFVSLFFFFSFIKSKSNN